VGCGGLTHTNASRDVLPHDSDRILSIDSFKNAFFGVRSALGKRAVIASRAVLEFTSIKATVWISGGLDHLLLCDGHQVLCAQVVPQRLK
jgi:hypothetical protein